MGLGPLLARYSQGAEALHGYKHGLYTGRCSARACPASGESVGAQKGVRPGTRVHVCDKVLVSTHGAQEAGAAGAHCRTLTCLPQVDRDQQEGHGHKVCLLVVQGQKLPWYMVVAWRSRIGADGMSAGAP